VAALPSSISPDYVAALRAAYTAYVEAMTQARLCDDAHAVANHELAVVRVVFDRSFRVLKQMLDFSRAPRQRVSGDSETYDVLS